MSLSIEVIRIVYAVFAGVTILGMIFLAILPMPESKMNMYRCEFQGNREEKLSHLQVISMICLTHKVEVRP